jgi:hypothetical protein
MEDQREVSPLSRRVMLPCGRNPYPSDYRWAFACSRILYPLPHRVTLRFPFPVCSTGGQRAYHVPQM